MEAFPDYLSQFLVFFSLLLKLFLSRRFLPLVALCFSSLFANLSSVLNSGIFGFLWVTFGVQEFMVVFIKALENP